jgi:hypothetical protein
MGGGGEINGFMAIHRIHVREPPPHPHPHSCLWEWGGGMRAGGKRGDGGGWKWGAGGRWGGGEEGEAEGNRGWDDKTVEHVVSTWSQNLN